MNLFAIKFQKNVALKFTIFVALAFIIIFLFKQLSLTFLDFVFYDSDINSINSTWYYNAPLYFQIIIHLFSLTWVFISLIIYEVIFWWLRLSAFDVWKSPVSRDFRPSSSKILKATIFSGLMVTLAILIIYLLGEIDIISLGIPITSVIYSLILYFLISFNEELVFRVYILKKILLNKSNIIFAIFTSSFLFMLIHIGNPWFNLIAWFNLFLLWVLLWLIYCINNNFWFIVFFHLSWNFFQWTMYGFNVSWRNYDSLISIKNIEANIINWWEFWLEWSIILTIMLSLVILFVWNINVGNIKSSVRKNN